MTTQPQSHTTSRRSVLTYAATILGAVTLAACGGSAPTANGSGTAGTAASATSAVAASAPVSSVTGTSATTSQQATSQAATASQAPASAPANAAPAGAAPEVIWSSWATDDLGIQREMEQLGMFTQTHPQIKVTRATVPSSGYQDKLLAGLAGGTGPDVFRDNPADAIPLAQKGQIASLDALLQTTKGGWWDTADVKPGVMGWAKAMGHQYGFPMGTGAYYALDINRDLFHAAGIADPALGYNDPAWTFDAVLAAAQKLTKGGTAAPTQFGIDDGMKWVYLHPVVMSFGGNYMDPKTGEFLWTEQPALDAIQWVADLRLKQHVSPTPDQTAHGEFAYVSGKLGLSWSTFNLGMYLISTVGNHFDWDIIPPPHQPGKPPVVWFYVSWWVENKASKVADAAWTFHYWLGGPEGQRPAVEYAWEAPHFTSNDTYFGLRMGAEGAKKNLAVAKDFLKYTSPDRPEINPRYNDAQKALTPALADVATGKLDARTAMEQIKTQMDTIMKQGMAEANP
jgi:multiple sugar transport system substrate-binding protein